MHFSLVVVASSVLVSQALAGPAPLILGRDNKRGFRAAAHPRQARSIKPRNEGAVYAYYDGGWTLPVLVGGQQVILNIDTGSSDLWTASTLMPADQQASVKTTPPGAIFNPSQSSTYQPVDGYTFSLGYGDGSGASGPVGSDSVNIGGATVPRMDFGVCDSLRYGSGATHRDTDGPVGLGFGKENSIRPNPQCTFMECLEPYIPTPIFCTGLTLDKSGFIDFGYSDPARQKGPVTTIPIANATSEHTGQWVAEKVKFGSGGKQFSAPATSIGFDLGNAGLTLPTDVAEAYFGLVQGANNNGGTWEYPCSSKLPDLDYVFQTAKSGPQTVTVPGANIANSESNPSSGTCQTRINLADDSRYGNAGTPLYISKYMIWNQKEPSLGFADQAP